MNRIQFNGKTDEYLLLATITAKSCAILKERVDSGLTILWNLKGKSYLKIDAIDYELTENQILCLTEFHKIEIKSIAEARLVRFNRPFYCINSHDQEVSCKGILFFGASQVPLININASEIEKFEVLWKMFNIEMDSRDNLQIEMLQMMLKRLIILCTRLFKEQQDLQQVKTGDLDIIRAFNYLVEQHFKTYRTVTEYAQLLHKSPKTLSNLFRQYSSKTPLQIIQDRLLLEARRTLHYTETPIKTLAYDLGFEDVQSFSRFFKRKVGESPSIFRQKSRNPVHS